MEDAELRQKSPQKSKNYYRKPRDLLLISQNLISGTFVCILTGRSFPDSYTINVSPAAVCISKQIALTTFSLQDRNLHIIYEWKQLIFTAFLLINLTSGEHFSSKTCHVYSQRGEIVESSLMARFIVRFKRMDLVERRSFIVNLQEKWSANFLPEQPPNRIFSRLKSLH